jgi:hypothetical protein
MWPAPALTGLRAAHGQMDTCLATIKSRQRELDQFFHIDTLWLVLGVVTNFVFMNDRE